LLDGFFGRDNRRWDYTAYADIWSFRRRWPEEKTFSYPKATRWPRLHQENRKPGADRSRGIGYEISPAMLQNLPAEEAT